MIGTSCNRRENNNGISEQKKGNQVEEFLVEDL